MDDFGSCCFFEWLKMMFLGQIILWTGHRTKQWLNSKNWRILPKWYFTIILVLVVVGFLLGRMKWQGADFLRPSLFEVADGPLSRLFHHVFSAFGHDFESYQPGFLWVGGDLRGVENHVLNNFTKRLRQNSNGEDSFQIAIIFATYHLYHGSYLWLVKVKP